MEELRRTPLTAWHERHGAKLVPFAGWLMPVQYEGIVAEHLHARLPAIVLDRAGDVEDRHVDALDHRGQHRTRMQVVLVAVDADREAVEPSGGEIDWRRA